MKMKLDFRGRYDPTASSCPSPSDLLDSSLSSIFKYQGEYLATCEVHPTHNDDGKILAKILKVFSDNFAIFLINIGDEKSHSGLSLNGYEDEICQVFYCNQTKIQNSLSKCAESSDKEDVISQISSKVESIPVHNQQFLLQPSCSLTKDEENILEEFLNEPNIEVIYESNFSGNKAEYIICEGKSNSGIQGGKKRSITYTNKSIALNVATLDTIYKSSTSVEMKISGSANIIMVSDSKKAIPSHSKRTTFSATSNRSCDLLPEIAGDPGISVCSSNPKIVFSNNHYNVVSVDSH